MQGIIISNVHGGFGFRLADAILLEATSMARGWESKSIEAQQEEAVRSRPKGPALSADERHRAEKRRTLELARARAADDLNRAAATAHKRLLEQTIAALDEQLRVL